jgi:ornithine cyclodeaminase
LRALLSFEDLIEPVARAFEQSSAGKADSQLIVLYPQPDRASGDVYVKTGTMEGSSVYIVKVSPWFAANLELGQPQGGFIAVCDSRTGHSLAFLDDQHYLSDIRTAAAGALAARLLAPPRVEAATIVGSGVQAYWQALALYRERPFAILRLWARDRAKAEALAARLAGRLPDATIEIATDIEAAVRSADVIVTATSSREPLIRGEWLRPGQHITAVGADDPIKCELDASVLRAGRLFVDAIEASTANGDVHRAIASGGYAAENVEGEIGDLLSGHRAGRRSPLDITVAKFVGLGAQDLAAAQCAIERLGLGGGAAGRSSPE